MRLPNGTEISPSEVVRWLGIWFDQKLTFRHHVNTKVASATKVFNTLQALANTQSGLSAQAVTQLYKSCVCTVSDYGSEIWWKGQKGFLDKLQLLQNKATRKVLGAFKTTPARAMEAEAAIPPPNIRLNHHQRKMAIRILTLNKHHPLRTRCPDTYPPHYIIGREYSDDYQQWYDNSESKNYQTALDRILSSINSIIAPNEEVEVIEQSL